MQTRKINKNKTLDINLKKKNIFKILKIGEKHFRFPRE